MASNVAKRPLPSNSGQTGQLKKVKFDDDSFDLSASLIDEMDALEQDELMSGTSNPLHATPIADTPSLESKQIRDNAATQSWARPPPPPIDPAKDGISFQQIDIDHYIGRPIPGMPGLKSGPVPILRMYGVTMEGNSVCTHLHGFLPYFYVPLPCEQFRAEHCSDFRQSLGNAVLADMRSNKDDVKTPVASVEICQR